MTTDLPENLSIAGVVEGLKGWTQAGKLLDTPISTLQGWVKAGYVLNKHAIPIVVRVAKQNDLQTSPESLAKPDTP